MSRKSKKNAGVGTMRSITEMVAQLRKLSSDLSSCVKDSIEAELFNDAANYIEGATDSLREHMALSINAISMQKRWLPIEDINPDIMHSAIPVLLWSPDTHTCAVYGRYWTQTERWEEDHMSTPLYPTHWMPLPEPPHD